MKQWPKTGHILVNGDVWSRGPHIYLYRRRNWFTRAVNNLISQYLPTVTRKTLFILYYSSHYGREFCDLQLNDNFTDSTQLIVVWNLDKSIRPRQCKTGDRQIISVKISFCFIISFVPHFLFSHKTHECLMYATRQVRQQCISDQNTFNI